MDAVEYRLPQSRQIWLSNTLLRPVKVGSSDDADEDEDDDDDDEEEGDDVDICSKSVDRHDDDGEDGEHDVDAEVEEAPDEYKK